MRRKRPTLIIGLKRALDFEKRRRVGWDEKKGRSVFTSSKELAGWRARLIGTLHIGHHHRLARVLDKLLKSPRSPPSFGESLGSGQRLIAQRARLALIVRFLAFYSLLQKTCTPRCGLGVQYLIV